MNRFPFFPFGGDYCPEQETQEEIQQDIEMMQQANINCVTLAVFSWALLEPTEGIYDFSSLDETVKLLGNAGIKTILATGTVSPPVWATKKYPDILPVDIKGRKRTHGMRAFFCVNSSNYRRLASAMTTAMARHFMGNEHVIGYHIANEYGTECFCDSCKVEFQTYLEHRYSTIERLNEAWYTTFWGRTYRRFDEIELPTELNDDYRFYPQVQLDYRRFLTASTIECYVNEQDVIREIEPDLPVFTNISGFIKTLDQFSMVPHMDYAGFDNYPTPGQSPMLPALKHDIMRAAGGDDVFLVAEQSPGPQNWQAYNKLKKPGEVRRLLWQGVAHGADGALFFQMRQSLGGQEMYHGALISTARSTETRTFKEMQTIGREIKQTQSDILSKRTVAQCGIFFDWENWWALELSSGPSRDLDYLDQIRHYYESLAELHIGTKILREQDDFSQLKFVFAPLLGMMKGSLIQRFSEYVENGGILVTTYLSGMLDENGCLRHGPAPGQLRDLTGIWVEEIDALFPHERNSFIYENERYETSFLCERIHLEDAQPLATYEQEFYAGEPCIAKRSFGKGSVYYFATMPESRFLSRFARKLQDESGAIPFATAPSCVEVTKRDDLLFIINHGSDDEPIETDASFHDLFSGEHLDRRFTIAAGDCRILKRHNATNPK